MSATRPLLVAVHGILSGIKSPAWTSDLAHWLWGRGSSFTVLQRHYIAGPFPWWNVFFKNRYLARHLARELRPFAEDGAELNFVAHSNGADIVLKAIRILARAGLKTNAAILVSGAVSSNVHRSGVLRLVESGHLGCAIAYCSEVDGVLNFPAILQWPYGRLGRLGWRCHGKPFPERCPHYAGLGSRILCRWFAGGHNGYFAPDLREKTFAQILEDLNRIPF